MNQMINTLLDHPASFIYDTIGVLTNEEIKNFQPGIL